MMTNAYASCSEEEMTSTASAPLTTCRTLKSPRHLSCDDKIFRFNALSSAMRTEIGPAPRRSSRFFSPPPVSRLSTFAPFPPPFVPSDVVVSVAADETRRGAGWLRIAAGDGAAAAAAAASRATSSTRLRGVPPSSPSRASSLRVFVVRRRLGGRVGGAREEPPGTRSGALPPYE
eukprot:31013-Pelagococcus_subviridis.AAC.2